MAAKPGHKVKITESRHPESGDRMAVFHTVMVGSDNDGWVELPGVTDVDILLRQNQLEKAIITVLWPQIDFQGKEYPSATTQD